VLARSRRESREDFSGRRNGPAGQGAQIICTQKLFRSQYFCQSEDHKYFELAESIPGPTTEAFQRLAQVRRVVVIASLFRKRAPGLYHNTAAVIDADGSLLGVHRKMHIPDDPLYYEKSHFTYPATGFRTWRTRYAENRRAHLLDQWYPEGASYRLARRESCSSYRHRLASAGRTRPLGGQHAGWEDRAARTRHCQRLLSRRA